MANENPKDPNSNENQGHESWLDKALDKINTDFPLSGGETDEDLESEEDTEDVADSGEEKAEPKHESWLGHILDNVDTDFPLSGGEQDEDLEPEEDEDDVDEEKK